MENSSLLFDAYRTIGLVCDDVPFAVHRNGSQRYLTASIGRSFVVYDLDKLIVKMASAPRISNNKRSIGAIAAIGEKTYLTCGSDVTEWVRGKHSRTLLTQKDISDLNISSVLSILIFGKHLLLSCLETGKNGEEGLGLLLVLEMESSKVLRKIYLGGRNPNC